MTGFGLLLGTTIEIGESAGASVSLDGGIGEDTSFHFGVGSFRANDLLARSHAGVRVPKWSRYKKHASDISSSSGWWLLEPRQPGRATVCERVLGRLACT